MEEQLRLENRKLMSTIQNLRGNILVLGRVRPFLSSENDHSSLLSLDGLNRLIVRKPFSNELSIFTLDRMFVDCLQSAISIEAESYAYSVLEGYNSCLLAYGPTGTGKTHTMFGTRSHPGLIYSVSDKIFQLCNEHDSSRVTLSVIEVYNDLTRDLLDPSAATVQTKIINSSPILQGLKELELHSMDEFREAVLRATRSRVTAATGVHDQSSRSHCIIQLIVSTMAESGTEKRGKLVFVDLAGSENVKKSGVEGIRLEETKTINRSLSALGDVMEALEVKDRFVPYRNSLLTMVLSDSLTRGSKVMMISTIAPNQLNVNETISTLNFSTRVRKINLGRAIADVQWKQFQLENTMLKHKLKALEDSANKSPATPQHHSVDQSFPYTSPNRRNALQNQNLMQNSKDAAKRNLALSGQVDRLELKLANVQSQLMSFVIQKKDESTNRQRRETMEMEGLKRRIRELEGLLMRTSNSSIRPAPTQSLSKSSVVSRNAVPFQAHVASRPESVSQIPRKAPDSESKIMNWTESQKTQKSDEVSSATVPSGVVRSAGSTDFSVGPKIVNKTDESVATNASTAYSDRLKRERQEVQILVQRQLEKDRQTKNHQEQERLDSMRREAERQREHEQNREQSYCEFSELPTISEIPAQLESSFYKSQLNSSQSEKLERKSSVHIMNPDANISTKSIQRSITLESVKRDVMRRSATYSGSQEDPVAVGSSSESLSPSRLVIPGASSASTHSSEFRHPSIGTANPPPMRQLSRGPAYRQQLQDPVPNPSLATPPSSSSVAKPAMRAVTLSSGWRQAQPTSINPTTDTVSSVVPTTTLFQFQDHSLAPVSRSLKDHRLVQNRHPISLRDERASSAASHSRDSRLQ